MSIRFQQLTPFLLCCAAQIPFAVNAESLPDPRVQTLVEKVRSSMRLLPSDSFMMGDWGDENGQRYDFEKNSSPSHKVILDAFSMMAYKVTYDDFDVFTDATGNERVNVNKKLSSSAARAPKRPAGVSWYGAQAYCEWLGKVTHLPFALPSEAQWEYAARSGGKKMLFATDNGKYEPGRNYPPKWGYGEPKPPIPDVGSFPPNPAGLYGMSEITYEWMNDWYDENYYRHSPVKNPQGPEKGAKKVRRGDLGGDPSISAMVFMRTSSEPRHRYEDKIDFKNPDKTTWADFPGFSSYPSDAFRCVVNSPERISK